jgi:hypothetical protein
MIVYSPERTEKRYWEGDFANPLANSLLALHLRL